ncbi:MAG TPA: MlaE family lipid ABC transporter permease subunit [Burkholderiaceae bacterium]|nr:MlaE family lipid ABC transporter permease subunit [Burkholderiaceae bacterium]
MAPSAMAALATPNILAGDSPSQLRCEGAWVTRMLAPLEERIATVARDLGKEVLIDASAITALDTSGAWLLHRTVRALELGGRRVRVQGLRPEFDALLQLVASRAVHVGETATPPLGRLTALGLATWEAVRGAYGLLSFLGEAALTWVRSVLDPRRIRWRAIFHNIQTAGFEALPITGLLSFLLGIVIAYQGAEQLRRVGANIYIADLVGLSMVRELSPLITAIIVAGRSGSAYTAQIGTMKVTEEIDALRTIGIGPLDLLVLPKVVALAIVLPLLTVYTDIMGIVGGMIMARAQLQVSFTTFLHRLEEAVSLTSYVIGVGKAPVFAVIIALVGCYQGFRVTGSAESVGQRTTVSVVQSIFLVILSDAMFSIAFSWLEI